MKWEPSVRAFNVDLGVREDPEVDEPKLVLTGLADGVVLELRLSSKEQLEMSWKGKLDIRSGKAVCAELKSAIFVLKVMGNH